VKAPLFPVLQWVGILLLSGILLTMAFSPDWNSAWKVGIPWVILVSIGYLIQKKNTKAIQNKDPNVTIN
jgi:L-asparagine transporter-like permease